MTIKHLSALLAAACVAAAAYAPAVAQSRDTAQAQAQARAAADAFRTAQPDRDAYRIGVQDTLNITVWEHADLTGKFTVQADGNVMLPIVGRVPAAERTVPEFESSLTRTLADGVILRPKVFVTLESFRARRIFVLGAVSSQGVHVLGDNETLIHVLAKAGYGSASEALILRPKSPTAGPAMPDTTDAEVLRVNLRDFEKDVERGSLGRNVVLKDGDTVYVPRPDATRVFVTGQVRNSGAYSIADGTTVLQALALAGGPTEHAALGRIRIMRVEKGKQVTIKAKLTDVLRPGDTLMVPERFF